mgnify:FL=1
MRTPGLCFAIMAAAWPTHALRAVLGGSGSAIMHEPAIVDAVLRLAAKPAKECLLCYLGTATYDLAANREKQVSGFRSRGVAVEALDVARMPPTPGAVEALLARADIVLVSGGNTLFAVDRWKRFGLDEELRKAAQRGCVLTGGSAGAICWFDAGHSDSADPESYAVPMLAGGSAAASTQGASGGDAKPWEYIRCGGLGVLPGLCCPHHDRTQSNGVLRAVDYDGMLRRHNGETGVCIDHFAALVVDGADYSILSLEGKPGTALADRDAPADFTGAGAPWIWLKRVEGDAVVATRLEPRGRLADALTPATAIVEDPRVEAARAANPSDVDRP